MGDERIPAKLSQETNRLLDSIATSGVPVDLMIKSLYIHANSKEEAYNVVVSVMTMFPESSVSYSPYEHDGNEGFWQMTVYTRENGPHIHLLVDYL